MNGWGKAGGGGGERAGDIWSAGADVTEASQKRKWLQKRGTEGTGCGSRGSPRWSQTRPSRGAVQIPRGPGRVTVKHWSHLGLTYTPCRPVLEVNLYLGRETDREDQPFLTRRYSRHRHRHIIPKARHTSPAMTIIDRDDGRRGRRGLSCEVRKTTRQHLVVSSKDGRQRSQSSPPWPDLF